MHTTTLRADVVVMVNGQPFNIAEALYAIRHSALLARSIERQARELHAQAAALLLAFDDELTAVGR